MNIPHLTEWLGDWAMEPDRFQAAYNTLMGMDLHLHMQTGPERAAAAAAQQAKPINDGNIAIVAIHGPMMKSVPSAEEGTSTVLARRKIRDAAADSNVSAILLHIDSPGGTVAGTGELAADVANAAKRKPVYAYIDDLGASAAYWVASQATKVYANPTAMVGSIGVYGVVHDLSARATMLGIKVHVIKAGAMKGAGVPGTEVSAELLAELQGRINTFNDFFIRGVASGRGLSLESVRALADGRVHIAGEALRLKLIDGVQALDETKSQLAAAATKRIPKMEANHAAAVIATAQSSNAGETVATAPVTTAQPAPVAATRPARADRRPTRTAAGGHAGRAQGRLPRRAKRFFGRPARGAGHARPGPRGLDREAVRRQRPPVARECDASHRGPRQRQRRGGQSSSRRRSNSRRLGSRQQLRLWRRRDQPVGRASPDADDRSQAGQGGCHPPARPRRTPVACGLPGGVEHQARQIAQVAATRYDVPSSLPAARGVAKYIPHNTFHFGD
jgi:signal peptide peptidase SppA